MRSWRWSTRRWSATRPRREAANEREPPSLRAIATAVDVRPRWTGHDARPRRKTQEFLADDAGADRLPAALLDLAGDRARLRHRQHLIRDRQSEDSRPRHQ